MNLLDKMSVSEAKLEKWLKKLKYSLEPKKKFEDFIKSKQQGIFDSTVNTALNR